MTKTKKVIGAAAGVAAIAAGTYFLYGKNGEKNRAKVKGWALKAKGEMLEGIEKLREVNRETYNKVVDRVAARYKRFKEVDSKEIERMATEARGFWNGISKQVSERIKGQTPAETAKKPARKHGRAKPKTASA